MLTPRLHRPVHARRQPSLISHTAILAECTIDVVFELGARGEADAPFDWAYQGTHFGEVERQSQNLNFTSSAIFGKWPGGDETDEAVEAALAALS